MRSRPLPVTIVPALLMLLLLTLVALPATVAAQDATPAAAPVTLGAAECTLEPIDPATYAEAATAATPQATLPDVATGQPADDDTITTVTNTIVQSIACTNAGDLGRLLTVIDPSYAPTVLGVPADELQGALDAIGGDASETAAAATPMTDDQSTSPSSLVGIGEVIVFPDGQVVATVDLDSPETGPTTTEIYLRMAGTRYVITAYVPVSSDATPIAATPAA